MLEPKTIEILLASGWYPDYAYDVDQTKTGLISLGFQPHDAALEFLRKFGGLVVVVPSKVDGAPYEACHFNALAAAGDVWEDDIVDYGLALETVLCPIGESGNRHSYIIVAEDGRIFSYNNPYICLLGNSVNEAMNCLCQRKKPLKRGTYEIEGIRWEW